MTDPTSSSPPRATVRPADLAIPELPKSPPVPAPEPIAEADADAHAKGPTRYGDWELKGIAIDF